MKPFNPNQEAKINKAFIIILMLLCFGQIINIIIHI
jgi:hypothetical protein